MSLKNLEAVLNLARSSLRPIEQAHLAGRLLDLAGIDPANFAAFWSELEKNDRERLDLAMSSAFEEEPR